LDTFEQIEIFAEETPPPSHALVELDNVILTPHISGLSVQALEDIAKTGVENMVSVLSGHLPHPNNIVNKDVVPRAPLVDYDPALFETDAD
jgi:phosphoglycerate dehydrogenase-like enzyme